MFTKTILANKIRLITIPLHETKAVTVLVLFKVGSRYEKKDINGASHFIEHMMFKGTKKRPNTQVISRELDGVGAEYNAFTGKDHTGYYIKINYEKIELALDILSDMLFNSNFLSEEIEKEKGVILEEINMYEDNPLIHIEDLYEETLYQGNSLACRISGSKETVSEITRQKLLNYKNTFYKGDNIVIGVAGKIDEKKVVKFIENYFKNIPFKKRKTGGFKKFSLRQQKSRISLEFKETEQAQIALGFPAYSYFHPDIYALQLLSVILGGNMSSRLFTQVRGKRGLAYFIKSDIDIYEDTGALSVYAGLDKIRINEALKIILKELKRVTLKEVGLSELKRAKEFLKGHTVLALEDSSFLAQWFAKQELLIRKILTPEEKLDKIFKVSPKDIKRVAKDIIKKSRLNLALIGPFKDKKVIISGFCGLGRK
ncbi:MAG: hypothetical protein COX43_02635 [Parcubacteria group bacterium CG23_combo_of_CG06-09_8_20_14_all_35_9]|nr:MAG: hypothetical protein COX43_02635 [Parcubacteria group bacterium CG23_combo_of_CG06-09_8_20_14_all_35_9]